MQNWRTPYQVCHIDLTCIIIGLERERKRSHWAILQLLKLLISLRPNGITKQNPTHNYRPIGHSTISPGYARHIHQYRKFKTQSLYPLAYRQPTLWDGEHAKILERVWMRPYPPFTRNQCNLHLDNRVSRASQHTLAAKARNLRYPECKELSLTVSSVFYYAGRLRIVLPGWFVSSSLHISV